MSLSTTAIFCCLDDFAKTFEDWERHHLLPTGRKRRRSGKLCLSEMLFIMVLFHLSPFKDFKHFWHYGVEQKYRDYFGEIPSYGRFVSLMPRLFIPFCVLMHSLTGDQTGIYVADSTKIAVCQQSTHFPQPRLRRLGQTRKNHNRLVLWLQAARGHQPQG